MGLPVVKSRVMRRTVALSLLLLGAAACSSGPSNEELTQDLFDWIAMKRLVYNGATERGVRWEIESVSAELTRKIQPNVRRVMTGLLSKDSAVRADAAFALGFSKEPEAIGPLVTAASDAVVVVRANAIASLGMLGFAEAPTEPFAKALNDPAWELREAALFGLRPLVDEKHDRGLFEKVQALASDPNFQVRNEAVILLGKFKRKETVDILLAKPIRDPDAMVRLNAAATLKVLGPIAVPANPFLIEMLKDDDPQVVVNAWDALNRINGKDFDRSYATWRDWYEEEQRHVYTCPDHREINESTPGECPICKKKLERLPKETGRRIESPPVVYGCPDHPEVQTTAPARCGKCGKEMVLRRPDPVSYVCPEHPDVVTSTPAKCGRPGCGKDLVLKKPELTLYICPDHPEVVTTTPGRCGKPGCGKPLMPAPKK